MRCTVAFELDRRTNNSLFRPDKKIGCLPYAAVVSTLAGVEDEVSA
jgi:hypothetical protein